MSQFDEKAAVWDDDPRKVEMTAEAVAALVESVPLNGRMTALEVGCGTGLAAAALADKLATITAVDTSEGMLDVLRQKIRRHGYANIIPVLADLTGDRAVDGPFDVIYSMMTFHHIKDIASLLDYFYDLLNPGGVVAVIDLDSENGRFHCPDAHVEHAGFDRAALRILLENAGFTRCAAKTALTIAREHGDFPAFLITAVKPA